MKKLATRTLALVLAFVLCFALASTISFAESAIVIKAITSNGPVSMSTANTAADFEKVLNDDATIGIVIYSNEATMPTYAPDFKLDLQGKYLVLSNVIYDGSIVNATATATLDGAKIVVRDNDILRIAGDQFFATEGAIDLAERSYAEVSFEDDTNIVVTDSTTVAGLIGILFANRNINEGGLDSIIDIYGDATLANYEAAHFDTVNFKMGTFTVDEDNLIANADWTFGKATTLDVKAEAALAIINANVEIKGIANIAEGATLELDEDAYVYLDGTMNVKGSVLVDDAFLDIEYAAKVNLGGSFKNAMGDINYYDANLVLNDENAYVDNEGTITVIAADDQEFEAGIYVNLGEFWNKIEGVVDVQFHGALLLNGGNFANDGLVNVNGTLEVNTEAADIYGTKTGVIKTGKNLIAINAPIFFDGDDELKAEDIEDKDFYYVSENEWSVCSHDEHFFEKTEDKGFYMSSTCAYCHYEALTCKFVDLDNTAWYYHWVKDAVDADLFAGEGNTFAPERTMTRAEFVTVLAAMTNNFENMYKAEADQKTIEEFLADYANASDWLGFKDVTADDWFAPYVAWAKDNAVTAGISATAFAPNAEITREQACVMLKAAYPELFKDANKAKFNDVADIADWAIKAVSSAKAAGLVEGDQNGNFNPKAGLTRAAACVLFLNAEDLNGDWLPVHTPIN